MKKELLSKFIFSFILNVASLAALAQSASVFDANYFNTDNMQPPIRVGKGFHINDVYKQTRTCFTPESCNQKNMVAQQTGQKSFINLYYTETNEDYSKLKSNGLSGKISFLNLFSLEGQKLKEFSTNSHDEVKRLIFSARVDFGVFNFNVEPKLNEEAKALKTQNKHDEFIKYFGTHYIDGVRKESSIWVILTEQESSSEETTTDNNSVGVGGKIPFKAKGSFEITDGTETNELLNSRKFSVAVEVNGPALAKSDLEQSITSILNSDTEDKLAGIKKVINGALANISDPSQALISQYYYSPFSLYGIEGINWDAKKQTNLIKINEAVINTFSNKEFLNELTAPTAESELIKDFNDEVPDFSKKSYYRSRYIATFKEISPNLTAYKQKLDEAFSALEKKYNDCANIGCASTDDCCGNEQMINELNTIDANIDADLNKLEKVIDNALEVALAESEKSKPECEKQNLGTFTIMNVSSNPYDIYQGDRFIVTMPGGTTKSFNVKPDTYQIQAKQKSGFLVYPTINNRTIQILAPCQNATVKVGFED